MLNERSREKLEGVHPDLVRVVEGASDVLEFIVTEGLRTKERQRQLYASGATRTLNSRHLTGHAVDLAALVHGEVRWDWPLYKKIADTMKDIAQSLDIPLVWGGDWRSFKDGPHFELDRVRYP